MQEEEAGPPLGTGGVRRRMVWLGLGVECGLALWVF